MRKEENHDRAIKTVRGLLAAAVLVFLGAGAAWAQSTASLIGTVRDPSNAVVAGATLTLTSAETGASRTVQSSESGEYSFPQVLPGTYQLSVGSQGFKATLVRSLELQVNLQSVVNINLQVASVGESVDILDKAPVINTADASTGNPFDTKQVLELPLEGRSVTGLLSLQTGVTFLGSTDVQDARNGSVNGGRSNQGNVTLDGVDVNDQDIRPAFASALRMPLDSLEEFRVTTVGANADQGRTSGAQISLITKRGSNSFHGSLYEFNRNTAFTANSFFNNEAGVPRPQLVRNVFGASTGGPVIKNRLFFFANYEGRRDASAQDVVRTVPTRDLRNGLLDYVNNSGGVSQIGPAQIKALDPLGIGESPAVMALFNKYPSPNDSTVGDGLAASGYRFLAKVPLSWNTYVTRLDWQVDSAGKHTIFLRANLQNDKQTGTPQFPGDVSNGSILTNAKGLALGYTHVLNPFLVGTFHYGVTRLSMATSGSAQAPVVNPFDYFLSSFVGNTTGVSTITPVHTISEDVNWTRGNHSMQFGGVARIIRRRISSAQPFPYGGGQAYQLQNGQSTFTPSDAPVGSASSPNGVMGLLGILAAGSTTYNYDVSGTLIPQDKPKFRDFGNSEYELYAQDSWHLRPNLTLIAGLRWSLMPPPSELNGQQTTNVPSYGTMFARRLADAEQGKSDANELMTFVARNSPGGRPLYPTFKRNFAPRLSLAYTPDKADGWLGHLTGGPGKTSIRLGAGMFYDLFGSGLIDQLDADSFGLTTNQITPIGTFNGSTAPRFTSVNNVPSALVPPSPGGGPGTPPIGLVTGTTVIDYGLKPPYVYNLNLTVSRQLSQDFGLDVAYVGRLSRRQLILSQGDSQPLNFRDPQSGMRLYDAMGMLDNAARAKTPVANIQPIPFWQDLFSNAATAA